MLGLMLLLVSAPWPATDPTLLPEALALPTNQPNDPDFGPGTRCQGQLGWYGFLPDCMSEVDEERARKIAAGASIDRAWLYTIGHPSVTVAVLDSGVDFGDVEVMTRLVLSQGELSPPEVGSSGLHDTNSDGAFNVLDYTIATSTGGPTVGSVRDRRLLARPDRGDVDGNGWLDPGDLLVIFSDGRDDDGNGFADDLAGWDFLDGDNDPTGRGSGPALHHLALATANDGRTIAGACPACGGIALRVGANGVARGRAFERALAYAVDRNAVIAATSLGLLDNSPELGRAVASASARLVIVASQGQRAGRRLWPFEDVLRVGAIGPNRGDPALATTVLAPDPNGAYGPGMSLVAPVSPGPPAVALVAGTLGLLYSAAAGLEGRGIAPLDPGLSPAEAKSTLIGTASDIGEPIGDLGAGAQPSPKIGFDERTGAGRLEAFEAIKALVARRIPPQVAIVAPTARAVIDPSDGRPIAITGRVSAARGRVTWRLEHGPGLEPGPNDMAVLASGVLEPGQEREIQAELSFGGLLVDPARPPTSAADHAITLRLSANAEVDGMPAISEAKTVIHLHRDLDTFPAFPLDIGESVVGAPRIADLDGDGDAELWVLSSRGALFSISGRGTVVDHGAGPGRSFAPPSLVQAGETEDPSKLIWATADGALISSIAGATADIVLVGPSLTSTRAAVGQTSAPVLADLDRDGGLEVVLARFDGRLIAARLDFSGPPIFDVAIDGPAGTPAVGDLDGDGQLEVVAATEDRLYLLKADGSPFDAPVMLSPRASEPVDLEGAFFPSPALADIDGDGQLDIVLAARGRPVLVFGSKDRRAPVLARVPGTTEPPVDRVAKNGQVAIADLDGDGQLEIIQSVATAAELGQLRPEQAPQPGLGALAIGPTERGFLRDRFDLGELDVAILDVDGDRRQEVLAARFGVLDAFSYEGSTPRGWPKLIGGVAAGPPAVGDLDGDGRLDVALITEDGRVFAWRGRGRAGDRASWEGFHHDRYATGNLTATTLPREAEAPSGSCGCQVEHPRDGGLPWALILLALGLRPRSRSA